MQTLPRGTSTKGPAEMFTGNVYFDVIAKGEEPSRIRVNTVRFAPCARTAWHTHALRADAARHRRHRARCSHAAARSSSCDPATPSTPHPANGIGTERHPTHFITHLAMWEAP